MRKLFIHAGAHKTASTCIQKWCTENSTTLRELGLIYPKFGHIIYGHHGIAHMFATSRDTAAPKAVFRQEIESAPGDVIVSSENFEYLNDSQLAAMSAFCSDFDVTVIYFYRNWTPLLYSMWREDIKHGISASCHEFCLEHLAFPYSSRVLDFGGALDRMCAAFGRPRVLVANYETVVATTDILDFFLALLGVARDVPSKSEIVNESLDPFTIETIRALNELTSLRGAHPGFRVRQGFTAQILGGDGEIRFARLRSLMEKRRVPLRDFSSAPVCRDFFAGFLAEYADLMRDDAEGRRLHVNAPSEPGFAISSGYLLDPEALSLLRGFLADLEAPSQPSE
jgi:hypothetical protein